MSSQCCPSCGSPDIEVFYTQHSVPTNSCLLLDSPQGAKDCPRGNIELGFCHTCGFICNVAFDQKLTEYSGRYEETQSFSPTFSEFQLTLAEQLIDRHKLRGKVIIEIGCGKGEFLHLICSLGRNHGIGFDPGYIERRAGSNNTNVRVVKDFYSEKYDSYRGDFLCCKMTLEHIPKAAQFLLQVRPIVTQREDAIVFFQVPDCARILRDCAFEDIYYEHCSYFSAGSLARLFQNCGFEVAHLESVYGGQYLTIEARVLNPKSPSVPWPLEMDLEGLRSYVETFSARYRARLDHWQGVLEALRAQGHRTVIWGSGSKAVSFLTALNINDQISFVVDINPYRQGYYMPGTGQAIVSPDFLAEYRPDTAIIMNSVYREEIGRELARLGMSPRLLTLDGNVLGNE